MARANARLDLSQRRTAALSRTSRACASSTKERDHHDRRRQRGRGGWRAGVGSGRASCEGRRPRDGGAQWSAMRANGQASAQAAFGSVRPPENSNFHEKFKLPSWRFAQLFTLSTLTESDGPSRASPKGPSRHSFSTVSAHFGRAFRGQFAFPARALRNAEKPSRRHSFGSAVRC